MAIEVKCQECKVVLDIDNWGLLCGPCRSKPQKGEVLEFPDCGYVPVKHEIHPDTLRLNWLSNHTEVRMTRKNAIKMKVTEKANSIGAEDLLRDYIDQLMQGDKPEEPKTAKIEGSL